MHTFTYPFFLKPDPIGGFVVTCRDLPEAITQGETIEDALLEAADCLDEALHGRMTDDETIPAPSRVRKGEHLVSAPVGTALKLAAHMALGESNISRSELARRLDVDEKEIRRVLDPKHPTKAARLEDVLHALGRRVDVRVA